MPKYSCSGKETQTMEKFIRCFIECYTTNRLTSIDAVTHCRKAELLPLSIYLFILHGLCSLFGAIKWWCALVLLSHTFYSQEMKYSNPKSKQKHQVRFPSFGTGEFTAVWTITNEEDGEGKFADYRTASTVEVLYYQEQLCCTEGNPESRSVLILR